MIIFKWGGGQVNFVELGCLDGIAHYQRGDRIDLVGRSGLIEDLRYFSKIVQDGRRQTIVEVVVRTY